MTVRRGRGRSGARGQAERGALVVQHAGHDPERLAGHLEQPMPFGVSELRMWQASAAGARDAVEIQHRQLEQAQRFLSHLARKVILADGTVLADRDESTPSRYGDEEK